MFWRIAWEVNFTFGFPHKFSGGECWYEWSRKVCIILRGLHEETERKSVVDNTLVYSFLFYIRACTFRRVHSNHEVETRTFCDQCLKIFVFTHTTRTGYCRLAMRPIRVQPWTLSFVFTFKCISKDNRLLNYRWNKNDENSRWC